MVHTIAIEQFGRDCGIKRLRQEIEKFNVGIQLVQELQWLVERSKRQGKKVLLVVVAIKD